MLHEMFLLLLTISLSICQTFANNGVVTIGYLTQMDKARLKAVYDDAQLHDIAQAHYALLGYRALGAEFLKTREACASFKKNVNSENLEVIYHVVSGAELLGPTICKLQMPNIETILINRLKQDLSAEDLFFLVSIGAKLNLSMPIPKITDLFLTLKKKDSSATSLAYILSTATQMNLDKRSLQAHFLDIEDILEQADEADEKYLYYEKGIYTTSLVIESIYSLASVLADAPHIPEEKLIKFSNFLYSRRQVRQVRAAAYLATALYTISTNPLLAPIVVSGVGPETGSVVSVGAETPRFLRFRLTTPIGDSQLTDSSHIQVQAGRLYSLATVGAGKEAVGSSASFGEIKSALSKELGVFELELPTGETGLRPGLYQLEFSVNAKDPNSTFKFAGGSDSKVSFRVLSDVKVEMMNFVVASSESSRTILETSVQFMDELKVLPHLTGGLGSLLLHHDYDIRFTFTLLDRLSNSAVNAHQVFVQLTHYQTHLTVTLLCQKLSKAGHYAFKLAPAATANEFDNLSGKYSIELIIGDALLKNSFVWHITDVEIEFASNESYGDQTHSSSGDVARQSIATTAGSKRSRTDSIIGDGPSLPKPDLVHTFRVPEIRASPFIAYTFSGLIVFVSFSLLLAWCMIGANFSNFPLSLSACIFHVGLFGIFCLYVVYWLRLDMFTTLRYLALLGVIVFISGHRLLSGLAVKMHPKQL